MLDIIASNFDDVTVYSKHPNHYLSHLRQAFEVVKKYNVTLRPDKWLFFQEEAELLRHLISSDGIKPASKTLDKIAKFELPKTKSVRERDVRVCRIDGWDDSVM